MSVEKPNLEAVAVEADLRGRDREKVAWLEHRVRDLRSFVLVDFVKVIHRVQDQEENLRKAKQRRGQDEGHSLIFDNLAGVSSSLLPESRSRLDWLRGDNDGKGRDIDLADALDVIKRELSIRYEEQLDSLNESSSPEAIERISLDKIPGRNKEKSPEDNFPA